MKSPQELQVIHSGLAAKVAAVVFETEKRLKCHHVKGSEEIRGSGDGGSTYFNDKQHFWEYGERLLIVTLNVVGDYPTVKVCDRDPITMDSHKAERKALEQVA